MSGGLPGGQERSGGPSRWLGGGLKPSQQGWDELEVPHWAVRGQEALLECWEGLRGPRKIGSFSRRAGRGWETLQKGPGGVGRPSRRVG